ncbi:TIGR01777 family protein [Leptospira wolffii]|uniref:TIGR01777 family oxidoreductase n=1 Tax=Leptospira wolffii TaxID=409998 RepID=UPI00108288AD|nr:TIGR01777 family oxidoreductase [Leptospira wolffii]TGK62251.1 TIGR01777 family protein [Leptospira wolffii]TGK68231.1 TIGR01777 family protein [Leptospira wolffii]TGK74365.1 TIGR01777 family protein [Leptospira wolffii]TGL32060.1 TIGR01777 family protein [Leptospira wolffii]
MLIGITGGTGLIGSMLAIRLKAEGYKVRLFSRSGKLPQRLQRISEWDVRIGSLPTRADLENVDVLINLAGEPIAGVRWTPEYKQRIRSSRVDFTRDLVGRLSSLGEFGPKALFNASAIGIYGSFETATPPFDEDSPAAEDELGELCRSWEEEALEAEKAGIRTVLLRTGVVLTTEGGALAAMLPAFRLFAGGPIGSGNQILSWVHIEDQLSAILFLLKREESRGAYNIVSPEPLSNDQFSKVLGKVLGRPAFTRIPPFALSLAFGEGAMVATHGQRVVPKRLLEMGYKFRYPNLETALKNLLG